MAYVDGFVMAVPKGNRDAFTKHAEHFDQVMIEFGATRVVECWADDVPPGEHTDFYRAVKATDDETIAFSWVEWPDKATRDEAMKKMMDHPIINDPNVEMPFDGKRMIFGSFTPVVDLK